MSPRDVVEAWLTAARRHGYEASARTHEQSFARVRARLERPWRSYALAGAVAAVALGVIAMQPDRPISYQVQRWDGERAVRELDFSDGTHIELTHGSALAVTSLSARGAALRLRHGHASLAVTPRKAASWVVHAGPYRVRVTGTAFDLDWSEATQRFEIAMQHGSVVVSGPQLARREVTLRAGERLVALAAEPSGHAELPPTDARVARASEPSIEPLPELAPEASTGHRAAKTHDWPGHVANGDFAAVLREAERAGVRTTLKHAKLEDLVALADAARYARRSELARRVLLTMRRRFPDSTASHDAAFLLGRMDEGEAALRWYERYLDERPNGGYTAQALGRAMMLTHDRGAHAEAARYAARYLEREPQGPYAQAARTIAHSAAP